MFDTLLIANRGEIACRIARTARRLGLRSVAVYSDADRGARHVAECDAAVRIGPAEAARSYLDAAAIVAAAQASGAQAVHPGYGFLSESPALIEACEAAGIAFVGPSREAIRRMGSKIESKRIAIEHGVPVVPGYHEDDQADAVLAEAAARIGWPVLIKASAGGGGKGMRVVRAAADFAAALATVRREARAAFGDERVLLERYLAEPRHLEVQLLGDRHGHLVHLFERECSIQRNHQKVIEEAPAAHLSDGHREALYRHALAVGRAIGYHSAGTVEFIHDAASGDTFFLEMNTRLQVEHAVTELITGLDLVEQMLRSAAGETMAFKQDDLKINGWAIESRIYAEDPYRKFLPSIGRLVRYDPPAEGEQEGYTVRNDAGVREGDEISMYYDPMISKLCTWAPTRLAAVDGMARALEDFHIEGLGQNIPFLAAVMDQERFRSGQLATSYIADEFPDGFSGTAPTAFQTDVLTAAGLAMHRVMAARAGSPTRHDWVVFVGHDRRAVQVAETAGTLSLTIGERTLTLSDVDWRPGKAQFRARLDGRAFTVNVAPAAEGFVIRHRAAKQKVLVLSPRSAELHGKIPEKQPADTSKMIISPMPGLIISMNVEVGQTVREGEIVCVIEAMKMQNIIRAEKEAVVKTVSAKGGDSVAADEVLVEFG